MYQGQLHGLPLGPSGPTRESPSTLNSPPPCSAQCAGTSTAEEMDMSKPKNKQTTTAKSSSTAKTSDESKSVETPKSDDSSTQESPTTTDASDLTPAQQALLAEGEDQSTVVEEGAPDGTLTSPQAGGGTSDVPDEVQTYTDGVADNESDGAAVEPVADGAVTGEPRFGRQGVRVAADGAREDDDQSAGPVTQKEPRDEENPGPVDDNTAKMNWSTLPKEPAPEGRILGPDDEVSFDGTEVGNMVTVNEDVYREVNVRGTKRPSYILLYRKGTQVSVQSVQSMRSTQDDTAQSE